MSHLTIDADPGRPAPEGNFVHCRKCLEPILATNATYSQRLEVIIAADGKSVQVRCKYHHCNVATIEASE